jgi:hypothetical protein
MRPENEPSLQNHTDPVETRAKRGQLGRFVLILLGALAAIMACVWVGIAVDGVSAST